MGRKLPSHKWCINRRQALFLVHLSNIVHVQIIRFSVVFVV